SRPRRCENADRAGDGWPHFPPWPPTRSSRPPEVVRLVSDFYQSSAQFKRELDRLSTLLTNASMVLPSDQDASGRTLGAEELKCLAEAIASGTLTSTKGKFTKTFEKEFAQKMGPKFPTQNLFG